jgi:rod shape determining protein RodA
MRSFFDNKTPLMVRVHQLNWRLISLILILAFIGFIMLYSAAGGSFFPWLIKQLIYFFIFFPIMILIAVTDIKIWFRLAYPCYIIALISLIIVDVMGHNSMGATRWVKLNNVITIQPSEIMKICMVFALAKYFYNIDVEEIQTTRFVIMPLLMIAVPAYFIFDQPDLGTATILVMVGVTLLFVAGVKMWKFFAVGVVGLIALPILWIFVLYDYQKNRILTFLNPNNDPLGSGYNIIQSKIAIGSGGFYGKGLLNGTQGQLDFLPERQTDFIFTMLSEELGFIGSVFTIAVYSMIIYLGTSIALKTKHQFGRLLVMGVMTIFFFHMFVNIGMVTGVIPVVGAPLPLISYGGTITATILIGFGLVLNADLYNDVDLKI